MFAVLVSAVPAVTARSDGSPRAREVEGFDGTVGGPDRTVERSGRATEWFDRAAGAFMPSFGGLGTG